MTLDHVPDAVKASADVLSVGVAVGTVAQLLPHLAALLTIIWTLIRIFETETVQGFGRWLRSLGGPRAE
jgi:peptidoglycan biosynthesis protein MviN/MurJ (putative lipid II flippase)